MHLVSGENLTRDVTTGACSFCSRGELNDETLALRHVHSTALRHAEQGECEPGGADAAEHQALAGPLRQSA